MAQIHVDEYKMRVYSSLRTTPDPNDPFREQYHHSSEAPALVGFHCANKSYPGCLTRDSRVRIHSCEKGNYCEVVQTVPVVWIQPVVACLPGGRGVIVEAGVGGGGDDLEQEIELDILGEGDAKMLMDM